MKKVVKKSFIKDLKQIPLETRTKTILTLKEIDAARDISEIQNCIKLKGFKNYYRIKLGDYRIGLHFENNLITVEKFAHRKDIYKRYPPKK